MAAMVLSGAIDADEGGISSEDAKAMVFDKASKDIMRAFSIISMELMGEV